MKDFTNLAAHAEFLSFNRLDFISSYKNFILNMKIGKLNACEHKKIMN